MYRDISKIGTCKLLKTKERKVTQQVVQVLMMCKSCWLTGAQTKSGLSHFLFPHFPLTVFLLFE